MFYSHKHDYLVIVTVDVVSSTSFRTAQACLKSTHTQSTGLQVLYKYNLSSHDGKMHLDKKVRWML